MYFSPLLFNFLTAHGFFRELIIVSSVGALFQISALTLLAHIVLVHPDPIGIFVSSLLIFPIPLARRSSTHRRRGLWVKCSYVYLRLGWENQRFFRVCRGLALFSILI
eukprot:TRINITY_DN9517_c0_g1_i1.p2 TRINITY_DN9517_c0_g1~~TRINITY_DN9517_c0_g1_i1.p2  ORF type:complete len:108 (+),score=4.86 TRINITY_DN9517_c0_g1_i1:160-483(+)